MAGKQYAGYRPLKVLERPFFPNHVVYQRFLKTGKKLYVPREIIQVKMSKTGEQPVDAAL